MAVRDPTTPPAGADLSFDAFAELVVAEVHRRLPAVKATRRGARIVTLRHGGRGMAIERTASSWIVYDETEHEHLMLSIGERRDRFVARNVAVSIAIALG
jgi:hypothetical protein